MQAGEYTIWMDGVTPTNVYCQMDVDGEAWTVIQRRVDSSTDFNRDWSAYKQGFGNLSNNFWLGLDAIHNLTKEGAVLSIDMTSLDGNNEFARYGRFKIGDESTDYKLEISGYSGSAGDSLRIHNSTKFSTKDRDNDARPCESSHKGGWWDNGCEHFNLNGLLSTRVGVNSKTTKYGFGWSDFGIIFSEMKIKGK